jgi:hypothetical protein
MKKFEYIIKKSTVYFNELTKNEDIEKEVHTFFLTELNKLGQKGFELIEMDREVEGSRLTIACIFKREIE